MTRAASKGAAEEGRRSIKAVGDDIACAHLALGCWHPRSELFTPWHEQFEVCGEPRIAGAMPVNVPAWRRRELDGELRRIDSGDARPLGARDLWDLLRHRLVSTFRLPIERRSAGQALLAGPRRRTLCAGCGDRSEAHQSRAPKRQVKPTVHALQGRHGVMARNPKQPNQQFSA